MNQPLVWTEYKITPDETLKKLAQDAVDVQDACNGTAVSGLLNRTMSALMKEGKGSDYVNQHPITQAIIDKLQSLAKMPQSGTSMFHIHCMELAEGNSVVVNIVPTA
jgi:hypothetical protein